jgi:hypothetical protein
MTISSFSSSVSIRLKYSDLKSRQQCWRDMLPFYFFGFYDEIKICSIKVDNISKKQRRRQ